jgi:outer membrane protein
LQAEADLLNARASLLASQIQVETTVTALKAILGFPNNQELTLVQVRPEEAKPLEISLADALSAGLKARPDLESNRRRIESQKATVRLAKMDSMAEWTLGANVRKSFGDSVFDTSQLVFNVSIPLFDGARSKNVLRGAELNLQSSEATLEQSERDASAEIETAYRQYTQNLRRLEASRLALRAAELNFQAASEARAAGAGNLIEVLTAQVTLVTAESNFVAAYYDTLISDVRFRLAVGQAMPGE